MPILCMRNFIANGVRGEPGKILSRDEIEKIGNLLPQLDQQGLVSGSEASEVVPPVAQGEQVKAPISPKPKGTKKRG